MNAGREETLPEGQWTAEGRWVGRSGGSSKVKESQGNSGDEATAARRERSRAFGKRREDEAPPVFLRGGAKEPAPMPPPQQETESQGLWSTIVDCCCCRKRPGKGEAPPKEKSARKKSVAPVHETVPSTPYTELTIGVPKETGNPTEKRVAVAPASVKQLVKVGFRVKVQSGAGEGANFADSDYTEAGKVKTPEGEDEARCTVGSAADVFQCDIVLKVEVPSVGEVGQMREGTVLISFIRPEFNPDVMEKCKEKKLTVFAMDKIPRISRAQVFDALSSMANIAGYKAVIEAASHFPRFLQGQMTAAGKVPPAKVLVMGAGVAGLAAIGTAKSMGAIVRAFDVRAAAQEQIRSLGGEPLEVPGFEAKEGSGGYAAQQSEEYLKAQKEMCKRQCAEIDILITTALIPGRPPPMLFSRDAIELMKPGSVVVDLAANGIAQPNAPEWKGGNVETTVPGELAVVNGVTHIGWQDLPSRLPTQSSTLYSNNITKFLLSITQDKKSFAIDMEDDVVRGSMVLRDGEKPETSKWDAMAAERKKEADKEREEHKKETVIHEEEHASPLADTVKKASWMAVGLGAFLASGLSAPPVFIQQLTTLSLSVMVGYETVWGVVPALHSPLMAVTNAISGLVVIGGLVELGHKGTVLATLSTPVLILASTAVGLATVNIFGGFNITRKMLDMFKRPGDPKEYNWIFAIPATAFLAATATGQLLGYQGAQTMGYLAASAFCILSINGLSAQSTARKGFWFGMCGVAIGTVTTLFGFSAIGPEMYRIMVGTMAGGALVGLVGSSMIELTELPQMVALFHSFVGIAATAISIASFMNGVGHYNHDPNAAIHKVAIYIGTALGGLTFTGSLVAFLKLQGNFCGWKVSGAPLRLPGLGLLNILMGLTLAGGMVPFMTGPHHIHLVRFLWANALVSSLLGYTITAGIGGADMPVAVTVLNSYSGWAMAADGILLQNNLLIIVGGLVGSSGAILSYIMCRAMNRSLANVMFGGYESLGEAKKYEGEVTSIDVDSVVVKLCTAKKIIIVVGYGMAVAKAQFDVAKLVERLRKEGVKVKFCIHPVAGRMPGQLNVLLADAGVPYDIVFEMDEVNEEFESADLCLVIGANDTINSAAIDDPNCPIAGMPVCWVWKAHHVVIMKRGMASGYAGCDNPVFFNDNTSMFFGDAGVNCLKLVEGVYHYFDGGAPS